MNFPLILHIETSTQVCSVALSNGTECIFSKFTNEEGMNHAKLLNGFIAEAMNVLNNDFHSLNAVAVSSGPGSYTGLRIGVSTAKGLCYGLNIPLISVGTLDIMAVAALNSINEKDALLCPMLDARRMEVYAAIYNTDLEVVRPVAADIVDNSTYKEILDQNSVYFFGNGMNKCKPLLQQHAHAYFIDDVFPLAENMVPLALKAYQQKQFVDTAYFEPFYLKEFQTTTTRKKMF
ncbi:MAG TPA: tRNA (adenosine(37)-N6)-threonylcarbamoyltransferase complex dimerization subunit type 1 TsaB [Paludibacteraceae bacterium]|jgi:tRNA threonylcarbamoyladenosine biosynthesis protein TsaB|nr:tRNA (adenosine(37)-N6)-threonylcarbamoyltransferase complex dimerization subunit type 1 TsaB [Bacteroidales bacterium]HNZ61988.1 tRNA (adenosine(37)-N6)-threonylcarbamoyltransferase complex dimerization subunit type 1 TsaB [Paludibacteraceae bacterium]HOH55234.1 tRNA (adenosine(37)-N6)-threonylcarbamoyltransferase complex dimerization subunit type 1 TsaB [Paludibacteraceae bacterium]